MSRKRKLRILHVVGARPNFMKISPIVDEMKNYPQLFQQQLVHTGQHYDERMYSVFFEELGLNPPDFDLEVGSGSHATQTAEIMQRFEPLLLDVQPDWMIVPGDVNSTLACTLVASKLQIKVAHVEAGLRSGDRSMPEEINRIVTDHLSELLLTPSRDANENLRREGIDSHKIRFVGNVMIDTLVRLQDKAESLWPRIQGRLKLSDFILVTLHRPSNVDDPDTLAELMGALGGLAERHTVVFPVHPRSRQKIDQLGVSNSSPDLRLISPLGYLEFLALQRNARLVITDSGGVQEETTWLGVPCLTVRPNTERPVTIDSGTNRLVESRREAIVEAADSVLGQLKREPVHQIEYWDGRTARRIIEAFCQL